MREDMLSSILNELNGTSADIEASAVISTDGLMITAVLPQSMDEDQVGAMSAAILSLGDRTSQKLARGELEQELIGQPHYILRHPFMPPAAFAGLWETIQKKEKWHGYVKNLRKDGGFYWVYATVIPNIRNGEIVSYTSVRRKPSAKKVAEFMELYPTLF